MASAYTKPDQDAVNFDLRSYSQPDQDAVNFKLEGAVVEATTTVTDQAEITSATASPLTSTETITSEATSVIDSAQTTSATASPTTATLTITAKSIVDTAVTATGSATPLTTVDEEWTRSKTSVTSMEQSLYSRSTDTSNLSSTDFPITITETLTICVPDFDNVRRANIGTYITGDSGCTVSQEIIKAVRNIETECYRVELELSYECSTAPDTIESKTIVTVEFKDCS